MAISNDATYNPEEVFHVLERVLAWAVDPKEFEYLKKGIGTKTQRGIALIDAMAVLKKYGEKKQ